MRILLALIALEFLERARMINRIRRWAGWAFVWAFVTTIPLAVTAVPVLLHHPRDIDPARLEIVESMAFAKADLTPAIRESLIPQIKLVSCVFSEKVIKHNVRPAEVSFPICPSRYIQVAIDDNLIDIIVSGMATIDKVERPFTIALQHNPTSVTMDGLIVTGIKVD